MMLHPPDRSFAARLGLGLTLLAAVASVPGRVAAQRPVAPPKDKPPPKQAAGPAVHGKELFTLRGHGGGIYSVGYDPTGHLLATASKDRTIKLWDAATGKEVRTLTGHGQHVYSTAFSPDGKRLASACQDTTINVWDVASGKVLRTLRGHGSEVYNVAFSPDGKRLASCSCDHTVRLWDPDTGKELRVLGGHRGRVLSVAFSPSGHRLASSANAANDNNAVCEVKLWDPVTGQEVRSLPVASAVTAAFSPDGCRLAVACTDRSVQVHEVLTGRLALRLTGHSRETYHVQFSPDGRRLASCSGSYSGDVAGEVKVWDLSAGRELATFGGYRTPIWNVAFSPDGRRLATASGSWNENQQPGEAKVWDLTALPPEARPAAVAAPARDLDKLWADLASPDAEAAYRAVWGLRRGPRKAVLGMLEQVQPTALAGVDPDRIDQLVGQLDDNRYPVRDQAMRELSRAGRAAEQALRRVVLSGRSLEARRRAEQLLEGCKDPKYAAEELQALRAVEVLLGIGTPEARPALQKLADGPRTAPVAQEAALALEFLDRRGRTP
jgi:WD40 repeat protein